MSGTPTPKNTVANAIKIYLFPSLVSVLAMMIWRDVNELRSDVKLVLAESNANKVKVELLEKQVQQLNQAVFNIPRSTSRNIPQGSDNQQYTSKVYAILNKNDYTYTKKFIAYKTK